MIKLKFISISIIVFAILGPLIPILLLQPSMLTSLVGLVVVGLMITSAYMLCGVIAAVFGMFYALVAVVAVPRMPISWTNTRIRCIAVGGGGAIVLALPLLLYLDTLNWAWLICMPSVVCGGVVGALILSTLSVNYSRHKSAIDIH